MANLLYEIGTEEMPAQYMPGILKEYQELAGKKLAEARIPFSTVKVYGTPRRMAFLAEGVAEKQEDSNVESKGPSLKIAFDKDGNATRAAQGFARGQGVDVKDLVQKDGYVYAVKHLAGKKTEELLPAILDDILHSLNFPKTMRWADYDFGFVRPFRWMVALLDDKVIPVEANDVKSGREARGHRFLSNHLITIPDAAAYEKTMEDNFVMVDVDKRRETIRKQIEDLAVAEGGKAAISPDLLEEVTFLVEYPTALCGHIDDKYLRLPDCAIITPMRDHQRYFPMFDKDGKLMPKFITVRNGGKEHLDIVTHGNERVLRARLDDAVFFFDNDRKKSLAQHREGLHEVAFQHGLGNMYDKTERLQKLCDELLKATGLEADAKAVERAALLSKADLVTGMVTEFTELQGTMGKEYALLDNEGEKVAQAIGEQYMPRFAGDELPQSNEGRILAVADKLDNIVATFSRGMAPTGSQDPYALRRQALGILNIVADGDVHFPLRDVLAETLKNLPVEVENEARLLDEVADFFAQRAKNMLLDKGVRYDVVDAVLAAPGLDDLADIFVRADALSAYLETEKAADSIQAFTRVENISKNNVVEAPVDAALFQDAAEKALYEAVKKVAAASAPLAADRKYADLLAANDELAAPVNAFFDAVMVMDKDEKVKNNRLALLNQVKKQVNQVADLSQLVMK
ncbi:glycine--tRNA ligase subunit beta [Acidaminococcus fermentans]|uniref:glycine--tRNA ligase subunit beta n=1 Tax=Acidaminococcus fermentans TaxID=905 RepID=UPI00241F1461|nr:glycine--tRNA ligase subunit beta [Acidaminococcus fermentans]MCI7193874.1 glycine--tRNA ligase subunit beta [Acidaminococcus fermentans]MDY4146650.1 glycine--tRNA ligase subunit beta [Acidaminococcus fermentans]